MRGNRSILAAAAFLAASLLVAGAWASDRGCITVRIDVPVILPDGSEHPAGALTLCGESAFSPVARFQRTLVNGRTVGMYVSRQLRPEENLSGPPVVSFVRDDRGRLALVGYAIPAGNRSVAYLFDDAWQAVARRERGMPWSLGATTLAAVVAPR